MAEIDGEIFAFLTQDRHSEMMASLRYHHRFRCPVCHQVGDIAQDPTTVVLYHQIGLAGGYSGESSLEPYWPAAPTLVRWWLAHAHRRCRTPPVQAWSALPAWATPGQSRAAKPVTGASEPAAAEPRGSSTLVSASVTPAGLPMLYWRPAAPIAHVVRFPTWPGLGAERLVDVVTETMNDRGAATLREEDLAPDALTTLAPLSDWYGRLSTSGDLTVWMPGTLAQRASGSSGDRDAARAKLCTLRGFPASWLDAAHDQQRILLAMRPPGTRKPLVDPKGWQELVIPHLLNTIHSPDDLLVEVPGQVPPEPALLPDPVGGVIAVGTVPDGQRVHVTPRRRPAPTCQLVPPLDVRPLWDAAQARARTLVTAGRLDPPASPDTVHLITLVMTALSRVQDRPPEQIALLDLAARLTNRSGDLSNWLTVLLQPTTAADDLHRATTFVYDRTRLSSRRPLDDNLDEARHVVERQWLDDGGGLRIGDHARWIPHPDDDKAADVRVVRLREVSPLTWSVPDGMRICAQVSVDCPGQASWQTAAVEYWDLLFADDRHARAVVQAAYSAGTDLWLARASLDNGTHPGRVLHTLHARAHHHSIAAVQQVLTTVAAVPNSALSSALTSGIVQLQALAPQQPIPGQPIGADAGSRLL